VKEEKEGKLQTSFGILQHFSHAPLLAGHSNFGNRTPLHAAEGLIGGRSPETQAI